jgi:hypothetical protein
MFVAPMKQYADNLDALRGFVEEVAPLLQERAAQDARDLPGLEPLVYMLSKVPFASTASPDDLGLVPEKIEELEQRYAERILVTAKDGDAAQGSVTFHVPNDLGPSVNKAMATVRRRSKQTEFLYRNSLVALVSSAEWFLAQILHTYFAEYPNAIGTRDKVFSLDDLQAIGSIEDAKKQFVEGKIEEILRGSCADWFTYLKSRVGLSLGYVDEYLDSLVEATQRRNLIIHNGGVVSSVYLAKVAEAERSGIVIGQAVVVDHQYLDRVICCFERVFLLIGAELWKKLEPASEKRFAVLFDIVWSHLAAERWTIAEGLSFFMMRDAQLSEINRLVGQFNYWQAVKWQGRFDEVRHEVEHADLSAKRARFRLGQLALLDDEQGFFDLLPEAIELGEIGEDELASWPIFRGIRQSARYVEAYAPSGGETT